MLVSNTWNHFTLCNKLLYAHICRFTSTYTHNNKDGRNDKDARRKTSLSIYLPLTLLQGFEKGYSRFSCEREMETEHKLQYFDPQTYGRQRCVFLVLQSCSTGGPGPTLLGDGFLYCILSASSRDPNSSGPKWPLRPDVAFLTTSRLQLSATPVELNSNRNSTQLARRTQLSYIIVRRPLDLWNWMFNRHQAEITVVQFRGHSLPVHQSMSVPWEFFSSSHFISQFPPTRFPLITAIGMCHLLGALPRNGIFDRVKSSKYNKMISIQLNYKC